MSERMPTWFSFGLHFSPEDDAFVATCVHPEHWRLVGVGSTPPEAVRQLGEVLALALEDPDLTQPSAPRGNDNL